MNFKQLIELDLIFQTDKIFKMQDEKNKETSIKTEELQDDNPPKTKKKHKKAHDRCSLCHKTRQECEKLHIRLIRLGCHHKFCEPCLKKFSEEQMQDEESVSIICPVCQYPLRDNEVDNLNTSYNKTLEKRFLEHYQKDDQFVICPNCQEGFIYTAGAVAGIFKDKNGELIRPKPLESLRKYRAECIKCGTVFCVNCGCVPFHEGLTCEEQRLVNSDVVCRFCAEYPAVEGVEEDACHRVCWHEECKKWLPEACMHVSRCGHACCGLRGEKKHFGCARCRKKRAKCTICLSCCTLSPSVILRCGHPCHKECLVNLFNEHKSFKGKVDIPRCNHLMTCRAVPFHPCVKEEAEKWIEIDEKVEQLINERMIDEETENEKLHVNNPEDKDYFHQPLKFARDNFVFYFCDKCNSPYYGGHKDCEIDDLADDVITNNAPFICLRCQREFLKVDCKKHGNNAMVYKCFFCCNPAAAFCWGRVYFCSDCHKNPRNAMRPPYPKCDGKCQFAPHAENGQRVVTGYCLECELEKEKNMIKV